MISERRAIELLTDLLAYKGKLKIITSEVNPDPADENVSPLRPSYFILHDVVRIEVRGNDRAIAHTEEGDYCEGHPTSLLKRLTEWKTEPVDALGL